MTSSWKILKIGGGGFTTGLDIEHSDGTKLVRSNTGSGYYWNGSKWVSIITNASLPTSVWDPRDTIGAEMGVSELLAAPTATSRWVMKFHGYMFYTTTQGTAWILATGFPQDDSTANGGPQDNASGAFGPNVVIDPNNSDIVFAGNNLTTSSGGLYKSTDGGATYTQISTAQVPAQTFTLLPGNRQNSGWLIVTFAPGSSTVMYAFSYGNGHYKSTNGGTTWTSIAGQTTEVFRIWVDTNGVLWSCYVGAAGAGPALWKYVGSTWTSVISNATGFTSVTSDPNTSGGTLKLIACTRDGNLRSSADGGTTWSALSSGFTVSSVDIPWLDGTSTGQGFITLAHIQFDTSGSAPYTLYGAMGTGIVTTTPPTSTGGQTIAWTDKSVETELLVGNDIQAASNGALNYYCWDRTVIHITNPDAYTATNTFLPFSAPLNVWSADWSGTSPNTLVCTSSNFFYSTASESSGYSIDGGVTWTQFAAYPTVLAGNNGGRGRIAAGGGTGSACNFVWCAGDNASTNVYYTTNSGTTWAAATGLPTDGWIDGDSICADKVTANKFYIHNRGPTSPGVYVSTNSGASWTRVKTTVIGSGVPSGRMTAVPGQAGHLFWTAVSVGVYRSIDAGVTWTEVLNAGNSYWFCTCLGFGKIPAGGSYPTIYLVSTIPGISTDMFVYKSDDNGSTWTSLGYPRDTFIPISGIDGDKLVEGKVYVATQGYGAMYYGPDTVSTPTTIGFPVVHDHGKRHVKMIAY